MSLQEKDYCRILLKNIAREILRKKNVVKIKIKSKSKDKGFKSEMCSRSFCSMTLETLEERASRDAVCNSGGIFWLIT